MLEVTEFDTTIYIFQNDSWNKIKLKEQDSELEFLWQ